MSEPDKKNLIKFPLLKLPFLPVKNTVKHMDILDIYKFSKSSKIGSNLVKLMKLRIGGIDVHTAYKCSRVFTQPIDDGIPITTLEQLMKLPSIQYFYTNSEHIPPSDQENECPKEYILVPDHLEECLDMAKQMNQSFVMNECSYNFCLSNVSTEKMIEILSRVLKDKCTFITLEARIFVEGHKSCEKVIDRKVLDYLMENLKLDAGIIINALFPENYKHENLFKFHYFSHNNASWVTVENLKSLRNVKTVSFSKMRFNSADINEFVRFYVNCDEDMVEEIQISLDEENRFINDEVLDQLISLPYVDLTFGSPSYHLIKVRHAKNRKGILAKLEFHTVGKGIKLKSLIDGERYKVQLETLDLMEKEKKLEKELRELEEKKKCIEKDPSNQSESLEELMEKEAACQLKLSEVRIGLLRLQN